MISKQNRLNLLLGVKEDSLKESVVPEDKTDTENNQINPSTEDEAEEEIFEESQETGHSDLEHSGAIVKIEAAYSDSEAYAVTYDNYEQNEEAGNEDFELEHEHLEEEIPSETEEVESEEDDVDVEMEATTEQVDESFDLESDDYQLCYVKNENAAGTDDEFVVYEDDIAMEEAPRHTAKRKYVKQSKDTPRPFKCWVKTCGSTFSFRSTMKKHMQQLHSILCGKSTCFVCGSNYDTYADFLAHMKSHTRKFQCDICKLTFVSNEILEKHKGRFHNRDDEGRNFQCHVSWKQLLQ